MFMVDVVPRILIFRENLAHIALAYGSYYTRMCIRVLNRQNIYSCIPQLQNFTPTKISRYTVYKLYMKWIYMYTLGSYFLWLV